MLRSKYIILVFSCLLASCATKHLTFDINKSITPGFLEEIPPSIQQELTLDNPPVFSTPVIYNTHFSQQYAEADNVLVKALLHENGKDKPAKYMAPIYGVREELYLIQLKSAGDTYYIYMSVWYDDSRETLEPTGFGPAYWGKYDSTHATIVFKKGLAVKQSENGLYLSTLKNSRQFFFVLDTADNDKIGIQRIVLTEKNKIGADKQYVFKIKGTKLDKLLFTNMKSRQH